MTDVQEHLLSLLEFLDDTAQAEGVSYWLDGGTLLGAKRHQGFIPWDHDIDVALLFPDYIKLMIALRERCATHPTFMVYRDENPTYWINNLADVSLLENGLLPWRIDIIPVVQLSPENLSVFIEDVDVARYFMTGQFRYLSDIPDRYNSFFAKTPFNSTLNKERYLNHFLSKYQQLDLEKPQDYSYTYVFHNAMVNKERKLYSYTDIFPLGTLPFEHRNFPTPNSTHNYLKVLYGDSYMQLPPLHQQLKKELYVTPNKKSKATTKVLVDLVHLKDYLSYKARQESSWRRIVLKLRLHLLMYGLAFKKGLYSFPLTLIQFTLSKITPRRFRRG